MTTPNISAEEVLETAIELISTGQVGLLVLDSLPSLVTSQELDKKIGERTVASLAGILSVWFRKLVPLLTRYECTFLFINQIRDNMDNPYVVNTPGGQSPKFYSSLRILFQIGKPVDFLGNELPNNAENPAGYLVNAKIIKQKSAPNNRRNGTYYLMADSGIREDFDFAKLAVSKYGIIRKSGAWFTMCDPETGEVICSDTGAVVKVNGMAKVYSFLQENTEYYDKIRNFILNDINGSTDTDEDVASESEEAA
jgi:recombination protein RecA